MVVIAFKNKRFQTKAAQLRVAGRAGRDTEEEEGEEDDDDDARYRVFLQESHAVTSEIDFYILQHLEKVAKRAPLLIFGQSVATEKGGKELFK